MKKRLGIISLFTLLFISFITVWNYSYKVSLEEAYIPIRKAPVTPVIPSETGVFQRAKFALDYQNMPEDKQHQRSLETYYQNRAFHGAPPSIPHPVKKEREMGGKNCLQCHLNGGFVEKLQAYTPVTPHPAFINCRQCHVVQQTQTVFKGSHFTQLAAPKTGNNNALVGSPPVIPHQIQLRESCLSCHAGPSAPKEIRVSHPERINCRQCHVLDNTQKKDFGIFKRVSHENN